MGTGRRGRPIGSGLREERAIALAYLAWLRGGVSRRAAIVQAVGDEPSSIRRLERKLNRILGGNIMAHILEGTLDIDDFFAAFDRQAGLAACDAYTGLDANGNRAWKARMIGFLGMVYDVMEGGGDSLVKASECLDPRTLQDLAEGHLSGSISPMARASVRRYLASNPGYDAEAGHDQRQVFLDQHGFVTLTLNPKRYHAPLAA